VATELERAIPDAVHGLLRTLWAGGHAAYVVGGSVRDTLLGRPAFDWDLATAALPERTLELFPGAIYENKFGTVAVGNRADLILLDANPLTDVRNIARRAGVMVRGRWLPASELDRMLAEMAARHSGAPRGGQE